MPRRQRRSTYTLRLTDRTDREVLALIRDAEDAEGYASSEDIAALMWPRAASNGHHRQAIGAVGTRLAWMTRYGVVTRQAGSGMAKWALTEEGETLLNGRLSSAQERQLDQLDDMQHVLAVHAITGRDHGDMVATLMRRAWQYGTAVRR